MPQTAENKWKEKSTCRQVSLCKCFDFILVALYLYEILDGSLGIVVDDNLVTI